MVVVIAVIVVAFSLDSQAPPLSATLVPDAFNGGTAYDTMLALARQYPDRPPGSEADGEDRRFRGPVAERRRPARVQRSRFTGADGRRAAHDRDASPARWPAPRPARSWSSPTATPPGDDRPARAVPADLSGTAVLLELAQLLSAQTQQRSVVLASTSAQIGTAGAAQLARSLPRARRRGDRAGRHGRARGPPPDRGAVVGHATGGAAAVAQHGRRGAVAAGAGSRDDESLGGQFLHLAFPLATSEQRPFAPTGEPAVLVSASGAAAPGRRRARPARPGSPASGAPCCSR